MRQQSTLGGNTSSREPVPKMAAIVPQVQSSPNSNGSTVDPSDIPDSAKTSKVVSNFSTFCIWH